MSKFDLFWHCWQICMAGLFIGMIAGIALLCSATSANIRNRYPVMMWGYCSIGGAWICCFAAWVFLFAMRLAAHG